MMNQIKVLASSLLVWAGTTCAQQADAEHADSKHDRPPRLAAPATSPAAEKTWHITTGLLIETENVEGQSDNKGFWEPTLYLEAARGNWSIYGSFYQENHNGAHYYGTQGRSDWFNQYEINLRYLIASHAIYDLGLMAGVRHYQWQYKQQDGITRYQTQRYTVQPDWEIRLGDQSRFSGWLALYQYINHVRQNALTDKELEGETGFGYQVNDLLSFKLNYYIDRGWNSGSDRLAEFSQQELRLYMPLTLTLWHTPLTVTPYLRHSLDTDYYNVEQQRNDGETDTRIGLLLEQTLPQGIALSLEYAYELQRHHGTADDAGSNGKYHYTGVGLSYAF
ncbi:OmpG family monomeric porin [Serratia odorifera]|uniref:OmpG family monomeric porin n=2 Tax=Serratia odorifera TaxID=618 RepID=UPI0018E6EC07|nr:OmpG family monomeric porin [Serratia odorifera]MBJ2064721.1 OmpG family monomeric porin [Serratia odorifera]